MPSGFKEVVSAAVVASPHCAASDPKPYAARRASSHAISPAATMRATESVPIDFMVTPFGQIAVPRGRILLPPSPSWPYRERPQHHIALVTEVMPHACDAPTPTAVIAPISAGGNTFWGVDFAILLPFANWPYLLRPQHHVVCAAVRAQANSSPAESDTGFFTEVVCGEIRDAPAVRPSCPYWLRPQHCTRSVIEVIHVKLSPVATVLARTLGT
ncbi:unannotated protein [freshwater metagenome]|uniref:Unannotated protein n=1 Tax=freshwater metagenome TaxID=449393 RepID=A0A6J6I735_9ZZZZ